jgi:hypothetical protein
MTNRICARVHSLALNSRILGDVVQARRASKAVGVAAMVVALGIGSTAEAFAWQTQWTTNGKKQTSKARHVSKGKHFLHAGVYGSGRTKFTAKLYKKVKGKDPLIQTVKGKDNGQDWFADFKKMSAGKYYFTFQYPKKGKKAFGGVQ